MHHCCIFGNFYIVSAVLSYWGKGMIDKTIVKKISDFVYSKPRTIQEISELIARNWRTADSYVERIAKEEGTISVRTFRGGTKGALKIVYWNLNPVQKSSFQERLYAQIAAGRSKNDFSPSEIYQYVDDKKKKAWIVPEKNYSDKENFDNFSQLLMSAESQILFLSGNLSFCNWVCKNKKIIDIITHLAQKGISMKILTRVELPGIETIKNVLALNNKVGREVIEIRHAYQPLRATIVDSKVVSLKELKKPESYSKGELSETINIIYRIYDSEWVEWMQKVFWDLFRSSISAEKRIKDLEKLTAQPK
jgi:hypothetical protein